MDFIFLKSKINVKNQVLYAGPTTPEMDIALPVILDTS